MHQNETTKQTTIFLPKVNKVFLSPILQTVNGRSILDNYFLENDYLNELKRLGRFRHGKNESLQEDSRNCKMVIRI